MKLGHCERRITNMVFNSFTVSSTGEELLVSSVPVNLPYDPNSKPIQACQSAAADVTASVKATRKSRGTHLLPTLARLLSTRDNWYDIKNVEDYQYPGKFESSSPHRLGFAQDITLLPFYTNNDEHFLFNDIQIGKGKSRAARKVAIEVNGIQEELYYRIAPCAGVKICPVVDCNYIVSTKEHRPCPKHSDSKQPQLEQRSAQLSLFMYGIKRTSGGWNCTNWEVSSNLHNHPLNRPVPSKVVHDIEHAMELDEDLI